MTEKENETNFEDWYDDIEDISDKGFLIIKNGLEYEITLTIAKKPKLRKQSSDLYPKQRSKYEVLGVNLINIKRDQKEIDKIIDEDPTQELKYQIIDEMFFDTTYVLKLTEQQYKSMALFMKVNKISLNKSFYFRRFGSSLSTHFKFSTKSEIKTPRQSKLKEVKGQSTLKE